LTISISSTDLQQYLESQSNYRVAGLVDLDLLSGQPRNTLYQLFRQWYKPAFDHDERIVLYSKKNIPVELLIHIQKCAALIDISNFFILICNSQISLDNLELVRAHHSHDDCIFSTLDVNFNDAPTDVILNSAITLPETFCFSPWAHLEISSQGEFKPCCAYKESITNSDGVAYNINKNNIEEVYNSDYLNKLRKDFLAGSRPSGCENCWYKEQHGGESNRAWLKKHLGVEAECLNIEQESLTNLISLDIKLGNLCNFKCRICNAYSSSKIAEEQIKHFGSILNLKTINQQGQWIENEQIWKMFKVLGNQLINIDFYGGEPFLNKQHETFLDYLIHNEYAKKIRLHYNSNGSTYPAHLFDKWKLFKQVDIAFSIDNTGKRFELERGGSWTQVEQNLDKFLSSKLPNMIVSIFTTVNVQNIYYLDQLIDWVASRNFNALVWNMLQHPNYLSITAMSQELTTVVIDKLNQIDQEKLLRYNILPIIELLKQNKCSLNSIDQLAEYMLKLDNVRQQEFGQTHPEIASIIYKGKQTWENHST